MVNMKIHNIEGQDYQLPNALTDFQLQMYVHLINWKWSQGIKAAGHFKHRGHLIPYDAILPDKYVQTESMPHIYEPVQKHLAAHRKLNPFRIHPHFYHMASSQAANINLFLPILHHPAADAILAHIHGAPKDFVSLATKQLDQGYCLEYWGGNFRECNADKGLLGDKSPRAGTDSDIAIAYRNHNDELCLWLIEHKLVETEFTTCGGFRSSGRKDKERHDCTRSFAQILTDKKSCYYHDKCGYSYWEITDKHRSFFINQAKHAECPFQGGMNQLWRNQLLALALEQQGQPFKHAHFSVAHHPGNTALDSSLTDYKGLIGNNPKFSVFTSADVLTAAEAAHDTSIDAWAQWYREVYLP